MWIQQFKCRIPLLNAESTFSENDHDYNTVTERSIAFIYVLKTQA